MRLPCIPSTISVSELLTILKRAYRFPELMKFFNARRVSYRTDPMLIDGIIYTTYKYDHELPQSVPQSRQPSRLRTTERPRTGDLLGIPELNEDSTQEQDSSSSNINIGTLRWRSKPDSHSAPAELFLFSYGTVVIWGMTESQER